MRRTAEIKIEASLDETFSRLVKAISLEQKVNIHSVTYDSKKGVFVFTGNEGQHTGAPTEISNQAIKGMTGSAPQTGARNKGMTTFLRTLFENIDQIPVDKLLEEVKKAGFRTFRSQLVNYAKTQVPDLIEIHPGILGKKKI